MGQETLLQTWLTAAQLVEKFPSFPESENPPPVFYKLQPSDPILNHFNPVHPFISYFSAIHVNITTATLPWSAKHTRKWVLRYSSAVSGT
jgi:hypothetical protein